MRIKPEVVLHETRQRVVPAPEIDGTHGKHDPQTLRRNDHALRSSAVAISAMRAAEASASRRTEILPIAISIGDALRETVGWLTSIVTKSGDSSATSASSPLRACLLHVVIC